MSAQPLFELLGDDRYVATDLARGPWTPDALHGGPVAALLAGAAEAAADGQLAGLQPTRLTVELLRPVPVRPLTLRATLSRPGRKVQLADADLLDDSGTLLATARLLRIRSEAVAAPVTTAVAPPPGPGAGVDSRPDALGTAPAFHSTGTHHRFVAGRFGEPGPATDWIRLAGPVVTGAEPTPLQRVAAAADFGNGISGVTTFTELAYINPDLTVHLHRLPEGEWVCLEAVTWMEAHGIALAESRLWDERGPIGRSLQSLIVSAPAGS